MELNLQVESNSSDLLFEQLIAVERDEIREEIGGHTSGHDEAHEAEEAASADLLEPGETLRERKQTTQNHLRWVFFTDLMMFLNSRSNQAALQSS